VPSNQQTWCELNGDNSQKTGTKHNNGKETAIKGVEFKLDNPDAGHDAQHNAWMADKIADWVYGEEKMRCLRHHCIVAFENCRNSNRKRLFVNIVNTLK
jgi:hypothetical protein